MLSAEGWVEARAEGTSRHYRLASDSLDPASRRLWHIVRDEVMHSSAADHDARRTQAVLAERSTRSQQFFSTSSGQWDRMRLELFGRRADVALLGLLDESWVVADLGFGTGAITQSLAPFVERVIAVDESGAMLAAAKKRLHGVENVDIRNGRLEALPLADGEVDVALLFLVLHYVADPARVISEAVRVLKPGGRLLVLGQTNLVASILGELEILDLVRLPSCVDCRGECVHRFCDRAHCALHWNSALVRDYAVFMSGTASAFLRVLPFVATALRLPDAANSIGPLASVSAGSWL